MEEAIKIFIIYCELRSQQLVTYLLCLYSCWLFEVKTEHVVIWGSHLQTTRGYLGLPPSTIFFKDFI